MKNPTNVNRDTETDRQEEGKFAIREERGRGIKKARYVYREYQI